MANVFTARIMFLAFLMTVALSLSSLWGADAKGKSKLAENLKAGKKQSIVAYGTSLTQGGAWVKQLQDYLNKTYPGLATVTNSGGSGQHSGWGLQNVQEKVIKFKPDVVFIEFSTNDCVGRFKLSVETAKSNITEITKKIKEANPDCEIIIQIMNPVIGERAADRKDMKTYQQMYRDFAKDNGFILIDHMPEWEKVLKKDEKEFLKLVPDGLHPAGPGYEKVVIPTIIKELGLEK